MSRIEKRYEAVTYDFHPKHILKSNGLFEWERTSDVERRCGHKQSSHLDGDGICLDKSKVDVTGICICEEFIDKRSKLTTISKNNGKIPLQKQKEQIGDRQIDSYIQTLAINSQRW